MINKVNVQHGINIMQRARVVNMGRWQDVGSPEEVVHTETELHACNTAACFAGHVAVSPEFQADGGGVDIAGSPVLSGWCGSWAIAAWLGADPLTAMRLCADGSTGLYGKPIGDITADDVIEKLEELLND